jgi:MFS transporter, FSR family, fosmidomycin resistance protein
LLPFISADLGLSYTQVGLLKATLSGSSSVLQIPAGAAGARFGEELVLLLGNGWVGVGLVLMALTGGFLALLGAALFAGLGGNAQHPLAAAIISRSAPRERMATAMGTLNFSGDLGKFAGPFVAGIFATRYGWRVALAVVGVTTLLTTLAVARGRTAAAAVNAGATTAGPMAHDTPGNRRGFRIVLLAGGLDNATRAAALTFLPFVFADKGFSAAAISAMFAVIFAGGAAGKFVCGWLSDRLGVLAVIATTELATALALLTFIRAAAWLCVPLAIIFGFALNGTSSALNVSVARFVPASERARGFGIYFTAALVSAAAAPLAYGALGDADGLTTVFITMALLTMLVVPVVLPIRHELVAR